MALQDSVSIKIFSEKNISNEVKPEEKGGLGSDTHFSDKPGFSLELEGAALGMNGVKEMITV